MSCDIQSGHQIAIFLKDNTDVRTINKFLFSEDVNKDENEEKAIRNAVLMQILKLVIAGNTTNDDDNGESHKVRCGACDSYPIRSDRYKCLNCKQLSLCAQCFEHRREPTNHKSGHAFVHFKSPGELFGRSVTDDDVTFNKLKEFCKDDVHESVSCDGCKRPSIEGLRFKCDTCPNYDLCQQCIETGSITKTHKSTHPVIAIPCRAIQQIPIDDIELGDELGSGAFGTDFYKKKNFIKLPGFIYFRFGIQS